MISISKQKDFPLTIVFFKRFYMAFYIKQQILFGVKREKYKNSTYANYNIHFLFFHLHLHLWNKRKK